MFLDILHYWNWKSLFFQLFDEVHWVKKLPLQIPGKHSPLRSWSSWISSSWLRTNRCIGTMTIPLKFDVALLRIDESQSSEYTGWCTSLPIWNLGYEANSNHSYSQPLPNLHYMTWNTCKKLSTFLGSKIHSSDVPILFIKIFDDKLCLK